MINRTVLALATLCATPAVAAPQVKLPSIVLVHGAWADGASWDKVIPLLEAKGYHVVAVHEPLSSLADDVAATTRAIDSQPGDVILVGHSWGGVVITEAGVNPKVKSLVYVAAFAPDANESINDLGKGSPPPPWLATLEVDSGGFARLPDDSVKNFFAQDLTTAEQHLLAARQGPTNVKVFDAKVKAVAWKTKPSWYVRTENDHIVDPAGQATMAKRMKATLTSIKSSHVAMLAHPTDVAAVIFTAAGAKK